LYLKINATVVIHRFQMDDDFKSVKINTRHSLNEYSVPDRYKPFLDHVLIPFSLIDERISALADKLQQKYLDEDLVLVCVLKGAFRFFSSLYDKLVRIRSNCMGNLYYDFVRLQSYVDSKSTGVVQVGMFKPSFRRKHIVIVEDIVESGKTLEKLNSLVESYEPLSVRYVTLLTKRMPERRFLEPDFACFEIPDLFIVGFGFDYNEIFREMDHICVIRESAMTSMSFSTH
ncbi:Hypoxanthine-guanine phosphoribosyltransferase, partial [Trichinella pseudospiralis]